MHIRRAEQNRRSRQRLRDRGNQHARRRNHNLAILREGSRIAIDLRAQPRNKRTRLNRNQMHLPVPGHQFLAWAFHFFNC
jgi:hypothetical protein